MANMGDDISNSRKMVSPEGKRVRVRRVGLQPWRCCQNHRLQVYSRQ